MTAVPCSEAIVDSLHPLPAGLRLGPVIPNGCDVRAIAERDEARLTKVPGVGKKTAQRILLELGDKMARESLSSVLSTSSPLAGQQRVIDDLRSALANLGYKAPQIDRAVQKVKLTMTSAEAASDEGQDLSLLLREALKHVS